MARSDLDDFSSWVWLGGDWVGTGWGSGRVFSLISGRGRVGSTAGRVGWGQGRGLGLICFENLLVAAGLGRLRVELGGVWVGVWV